MEKVKYQTVNYQTVGYKTRSRLPNRGKPISGSSNVTTPAKVTPTVDLEQDPKTGGCYSNTERGQMGQHTPQEQ